MAIACKANISGSGRRRRTLVGLFGLLTAAGMAVWLALTHAPWTMRLLLFLPVSFGTLSLLQVRRNTCVAHAAAGTFENEDFSVTKVEEEEKKASRRMALSIVRDALLIGALVAGLAALL